jgi:hypothetical protein
MKSAKTKSFSFKEKIVQIRCKEEVNQFQRRESMLTVKSKILETRKIAKKILFELITECLKVSAENFNILLKKSNAKNRFSLGLVDFLP